MTGILMWWFIRFFQKKNRFFSFFQKNNFQLHFFFLFFQKNFFSLMKKQDFVTQTAREIKLKKNILEKNFSQQENFVQNFELWGKNHFFLKNFLSSNRQNIVSENIQKWNKILWKNFRFWDKKSFFLKIISQV